MDKNCKKAIKIAASPKGGCYKLLAIHEPAHPPATMPCDPYFIFCRAMPFLKRVNADIEHLGSAFVSQTSPKTEIEHGALGILKVNETQRIVHKISIRTLEYGADLPIALLFFRDLHLDLADNCHAVKSFPYR